MSEKGNKYIQLFKPGKKLTGTKFEISDYQLDQTVITGGFEIGKIKIAGTGTAFTTEISVGDTIAIGSQKGYQEREVTIHSSRLSDLLLEDESGIPILDYNGNHTILRPAIIPSTTGGTTRTLQVINRRIKYVVDSITSNTEFITK